MEIPEEILEKARRAKLDPGTYSFKVINREKREALTQFQVKTIPQVGKYTPKYNMLNK